MKSYLGTVPLQSVPGSSTPQAQLTAQVMREGLWLAPGDARSLQGYLNGRLGGASVHLGRGLWRFYKRLVLRPWPRAAGNPDFAGPLAMLGDYDAKFEPRWTPTGAAATDHMLEIYRDRTVVRDLWISHGSAYAGASLYIHDCADVFIDNIYMDVAQVGLYLKNVARAHIGRITIRSLNSTGILMENSADCSIGQCVFGESATSDEVIMDAACDRNAIVGNDFGLTGVINGASLGVGNRPVLGDTSLNVCGAVT